MVEAARSDRGRKVQRMLGAVDVGRALRIRARREVVDRGEMEEVPDLAVERAHLRRADTTLRRRHVAFDDDDPLHVPAHLLRDRIELPARILAHQHVDRSLALEQVGDQVAAEETGGAGDEVAHAHAPGDCRRTPRR